MIVIIAGSDRSNLITECTVTHTLAGRSTASLRLFDATDAVIPEAGQSIVIQHGSQTIFGGSIESVKRELWPQTSYYFHSIDAVDHHRILDRRVAGEREWSNVSAGQIVRDLIASISGEGIGSDNVADGPMIDQYRCDYQTVAEAIDQVASLAKMLWRIDDDKELWLYSPGSQLAPVSFGTPCLNAESIEERTTREAYANKIILKLGAYIRAEQTARFTSAGRIEEDGEWADPSQALDGARKAFSCSYPIVASPRVYVDGIEQTVGVDDVDEGKQWYWGKGSNTVRQDDGQLPLSSSQTLYVSYQGMDSAKLAAQNNDEIDARALVEGNTGIYERTVDISEETAASSAQQLAQSILDGVDSLGKSLSITTATTIEPDCVALRCGQMLTLSAPGFTPGQYLIRQITWSSDDVPGHVQCTIEAFSGASAGDAVSFFKDLAQLQSIIPSAGPLQSQAAAVPAPQQPDQTGWSVALGPVQPRAYTHEPEQRVDISITRALPADADYWEIWTKRSGEKPGLAAAAKSSYPATTAIEIWTPQEDSGYVYYVILRAASASWSGVPPADGDPWKSVTVPSISAAPSPSTWSVTLEYSSSPINGFYRGRYAFSATIPASSNNAAIVTEIRPHSGGAWAPLSGYQSDPVTGLQSGGTFTWNQGEFSPESWERPETPMQWDIRLGVEDHRGVITWHSTVMLLTVSAGGGFQVTALQGKLGRGLGISGGVIQTQNIDSDSLASNVQFVVDVTASENSNGELLIAFAGTVVRNTINGAMYRWDAASSRYKRKTGAGELYADTVAAANIIAGAVGTRELATTNILVGAGGGKPPQFRVVDASGNMIGFIGNDGDNFVGGYFQRLRVAPSFDSSQRIEASVSGVSIENVPLSIAGSGYNTDINASDGIKVTNSSNGSYAKLDSVGLTAAQASLERYVLIGWGGMQLVDSSGVSTTIQYSGMAVSGAYGNPIMSYSRFGVSSASSGAYVNLSGSGSYIRADSYRFGVIYNENIYLGGITIQKYIPAYDQYGTWLGKIPIIP